MKLKKYLPQIFIGLSVVSLVAGVVVGLYQHQQNVEAVKQAVASGTVAPATNKPTASDFNNYKVAADLPRYIFIPTTNVKAIVRSLGVTKTNQIAAPANVYDTGWFNQSSKPGQPGAMVVDGHVSSWTTKGVFYNLKALKAGDSIQIQKGDGTKVTYAVVKTQVYDAKNVDMQALLNPINPKQPGLNLITCTGSVIKGTNEFDKRIVVFATEK
jgi:LPXTG-site transpeptidase (sortase) family protein